MYDCADDRAGYLTRPIFFCTLGAEMAGLGVRLFFAILPVPGGDLASTRITKPEVHVERLHLAR